MHPVWVTLDEAIAHNPSVMHWLEATMGAGPNGAPAHTRHPVAQSMQSARVGSSCNRRSAIGSPQAPQNP